MIYCFEYNSIERSSVEYSCKIVNTNKQVNKFLLAGDKFMPETDLKQLKFTYSVCRTFTKSKETVQKFKETGDKKLIYKNELDKVCFQHDMAYGDFKDLAKRTDSAKVFNNKA